MAECQCVRCGACKGTGQMEVRTGDYPEWELESCLDCDGSGLSEVCAHCEEMDERESWGEMENRI